MIRHIAILAAIFASSVAVAEPTHVGLDYERLIMLDAERLAETGIKDAYDLVTPALAAYVGEPAILVEHVNSDSPSYSIECAGNQYVIYAPSIPGSEAESWGRATYAFFAIINAQLNGSGVRFYAINGGNDLGGMFLTQAQAEDARRTLAAKSDWPYLPSPEPPWYGQYHD